MASNGVVPRYVRSRNTDAPGTSLATRSKGSSRAVGGADSAAASGSGSGSGTDVGAAGSRSGAGSGSGAEEETGLRLRASGGF